MSDSIPGSASSITQKVVSKYPCGDSCPARRLLPGLYVQPHGSYREILLNIYLHCLKVVIYLTAPSIPAFFSVGSPPGRPALRSSPNYEAPRPPRRREESQLLVGPIALGRGSNTSSLSGEALIRRHVRGRPGRIVPYLHHTSPVNHQEFQHYHYDREHHYQYEIPLPPRFLCELPRLERDQTQSVRGRFQIVLHLVQHPA